MNELYDHHWDDIRSSRIMRFAIILSFVFHIIVGYALMAKLFVPTLKPPQLVYELEFAPPYVPESEKKQVENAPPPPPPPPKPKVEEPTPEPKKEEPKKEEPKPEPKKEEPTPEPKREEPKPEPKKEEPKPEPKKEEPKPDPPKPKPEPPKPMEPEPEVVAKAQTEKGVQTKALPNILSGWGRLVQRKVEGVWQIPGGILLSEENRELHVSFWVDRNGNLLGKPEIIKNVADPTLAAACIRAITAAVPLPPLPNEFVGKEQQVVYVFSLLD